jgi:cytidylate kinase
VEDHSQATPYSNLSEEELARRLQYKGSVCIAGLTASGKTTHSHLLAGEFGLTYVSGSQIKLNFMGVSPVQSKDFWITEEGKGLRDDEVSKRVDAEMLRLESIAEGYVFDTHTMPWRHKRPTLCIWLESTLESRIIKSFISHRGTSKLSLESYRERIIEKDTGTTTRHKRLYNINIGIDSQTSSFRVLQPFALCSYLMRP